MRNSKLEKLRVQARVHRVRAKEIFNENSLELKNKKISYLIKKLDKDKNLGNLSHVLSLSFTHEIQEFQKKTENKIPFNHSFCTEYYFPITMRISREINSKKLKKKMESRKTPLFLLKTIIWYIPLFDSSKKRTTCRILLKENHEGKVWTGNQTISDGNL